MTEPPTADDAIARVSAQLDAVKRQKPATAIQARARAAELIRLNQIVVAAERQMLDATAAQLIASSNGHANGHAAPVVASYLTDELISALAKGIAPFVRQVVAEAVAPRDARLDEVERVLRSLVESAARHD
jgi:hypothetical protein